MRTQQGARCSKLTLRFALRQLFRWRGSNRAIAPGPSGSGQDGPAGRPSGPVFSLVSGALVGSSCVRAGACRATVLNLLQQRHLHCGLGNAPGPDPAFGHLIRQLAVGVDRDRRSARGHRRNPKRKKRHPFSFLAPDHGPKFKWMPRGSFHRTGWLSAVVLIRSAAPRPEPDDHADRCSPVSAP